MSTGKMKNKVTVGFCILTVAAMLFAAGGCGSANNGKEKADKTADVAVETETGSETETTVLGEGEKVFDVNVVDRDGKTTVFEIHTDKETVGEALLEVELIAGEEGEYGLYVETVNGITADYDTDGAYWAFYIDGEYAVTGVDETELTEGVTYSFKVER